MLYERSSHCTLTFRIRFLLLKKKKITKYPNRLFYPFRFDTIERIFDAAV